MRGTIPAPRLECDSAESRTQDESEGGLEITRVPDIRCANSRMYGCMNTRLSFQLRA